MSGRWLAISMLLFSTLQAVRFNLRAEEPPTSDASIRASAESLISRLKSPNKPANPDRTPLIGYPTDYDFKAQEKVSEAERKLVNLGQSAFPILVEHLNDPEYSQSFDTALLSDFTVGEVCYMIIRRQIEPADRRGYKIREGSDGKSHTMPHYFHSYYKSGQPRKDQLSRWWAGHRDKTIQEMQIEALEWTIEEEKRIGFPGRRDRELYLDPLVRKLAELKKE
jgi:hypothetical protein